MRYQLEKLGRASICHCRMCQKAMGNYFAPLVVAEGFEWVRGKPARFASSNVSNRVFCAVCGTPLVLETGDEIELAIPTLDDPTIVSVDYHANVNDRLEVSMKLHEIPEASSECKKDNDEWNAGIVSNQHPDHPTDTWKVKQ
ncbi:MAG: GFA family protein [Rhizobiaceae bacterium]|nr:GFA family protein [Rhizobiaceae bacterium]